jgi:hypothetical protein
MINQGPVIEGLTQNNFIVEKGLAKAIHPEEKGENYYRWAESGARDYDTAFMERIQMPFENGLLVVKKSDGTIKFDDRKLRFSGYSRKGDHYALRIAPTHFGEIRRTDVRAAMDEIFEAKLLNDGKRDFDDPLAYLACSVAVNSVPITNEGYIHVFRRSQSQELFPGRFDVTGGFVDIGDRLGTLPKENMTEQFKQLLAYTARKEFIEESGSDAVTFELTGLVKGANFVFTHLAFLNVDHRRFMEKRSGAVDASETSAWVTLKSLGELSRFLDLEERNITPTAYHALRFHLE